MLVKEKIYLGTSNSIYLNFKRKSNGVWLNYSLSGVSRVILYDIDGGWSIDSDAAGASGVFDWTLAGYPARLKITAGGQSIDPGTYNCYIKLFTPNDSTGLRWDDTFQIEVI